MQRRSIESGKVLILSRHAATLSGPNPSLSETGMQQAQSLAERYAGVPLASVTSSRLRRAVETAKPMAEAHGLDVVTDPRLCERAVGTMADTSLMSPAEVAALRRIKIDLWSLPREIRNSLIPFPGMESNDQILDRLHRFAHGLPETAPIDPVEIPVDTPVLVDHKPHFAMTHSDVLGPELDSLTEMNYVPGYTSVMVLGIDSHPPRVRLLGLSGMKLRAAS